MLIRTLIVSERLSLATTTWDLTPQSWQDLRAGGTQGRYLVFCLPICFPLVASSPSSHFPFEGQRLPHSSKRVSSQLLSSPSQRPGQGSHERGLAPRPSPRAPHGAAPAMDFQWREAGPTKVLLLEGKKHSWAFPPLGQMDLCRVRILQVTPLPEKEGVAITGSMITGFFILLPPFLD